MNAFPNSISNRMFYSLHIISSSATALYSGFIDLKINNEIKIYCMHVPNELDDCELVYFTLILE